MSTKTDENPNHISLTDLGRESKRIAKSIVSELNSQEQDYFSKGKIQSKLKHSLKENLEQIDKILLTELKS